MNATDIRSAPDELTFLRLAVDMQLLFRIAHERGWGAQDDMVSKLERLATLREQGALTADEFEAAKKALIGGGER